MNHTIIAFLYKHWWLDRSQIYLTIIIIIYIDGLKLRVHLDFTILIIYYLITIFIQLWSIQNHILILSVFNCFYIEYFWFLFILLFSLLLFHCLFIHEVLFSLFWKPELLLWFYFDLKLWNFIKYFDQLFFVQLFIIRQKTIVLLKKVVVQFLMLFK